MFKQKKLSLGARFGLSVASFILGLLLFFSAVATVLVADVQTVISKDGIIGIIRTIMSAPARVRPHAPVVIAGEGGLRIVPNIRTYQMPRREEPSEDPGDVAAGLTEQLIEMFYEGLGEQFQEVLPVTQEEFTQLINESTVIDYIADKTASLITDYFNDEITTTFEPEEIVQLINENAAIIEAIAGAPIPDDIAQEVAKVFDENEIIVKVEQEGLAGFIKATGLEIPGISGSGDLAESADGEQGGFDLRQIMKDAQEVCSTQNLISGIFICLVLMAAIILINCRQLGKGLRRAGYPLIFAGSIHFALNGAVGLLSDILNTLVADDPSFGPIAIMIPKLLRHILSQTAVVSIVILSVGCILFVGGIVLSIVLRPKKSPVSVAMTPETEELASALVDDTPVEVICEADSAEEECDEEECAEEDVAPVSE